MGLALYPEHALERMHVQVRLGQQVLELGVLRLQLAQPPGILRLHAAELGAPLGDQISGRFSPNRGIVGIVCCRAFENRARFVERCRDTFRDQRGLVIAIDDLIVAALLRLIETNRRQDIDDQIGRLVDDVCMA